MAFLIFLSAKGSCALWDAATASYGHLFYFFLSFAQSCIQQTQRKSMAKVSFGIIIMGNFDLIGVHDYAN